jgi:hypothetical protein
MNERDKNARARALDDYMVRPEAWTRGTRSIMWMKYAAASG